MSRRGSDAGGLPPDLAATVHDTTNALTVVLGWIERAGLPGADREEALERAASHARWARDQLRNVIGAPAAGADPGPDDASEVARLTIDDLAVEAQRAGVVLESTVAEDAASRLLPAATAAWQVLTNLLLNAIGMTPAGGRVALELAAAAPGFVRFTVRDEGPGIPAERRATLFDGGFSTRPGGAGLGLKHAHDIAAEHGGELGLGEQPKGACFELLWPARAAGAKSLDGMRVLLLEDDAAVIELLELSLSARGADLTVVRTADHLDRELGANAFDVVLIDLSPLSSAGSPDTARLGRIVALGRAQRPDVTVVAISGSVASTPAPDILWVRKPFAPGELADAILRARS